MRILVSGAGVAGPVLAYWLTKHGFSVTAVERAPTLRRNGGRAVDLFRATAHAEYVPAEVSHRGSAVSSLTYPLLRAGPAGREWRASLPSGPLSVACGMMRGV